MPAQKSEDVPKPTGWRLDPHTGADPEAMKRAGIVRYAPMPWGDHHDTRKIQAEMPELKLRFIETAHFRIGSSLEEMTLPRDSKAKRRLFQDLRAIKKERLPGLNLRMRSIDPWLRLHLYAYRLERYYTEWQAMLGVTDESFPKERKPMPIKVPDDYMGRGPYLGMPEKTAVLMLVKPSNLTRYVATATGKPQQELTPTTLYFEKTGCFFFGTATDFKEGNLKDDHDLHANIVFAMSFILLNGYKSYRFNLPPWLADGVANYRLRKLDPDKHAFSGMKGGDPKQEYDPKWARNVRRLVKNGFAQPWEKISRLPSPGDLTLADHMCNWSRIEFMVRQDDGRKFARFMAIAKGPVPHEVAKTPTFEAVVSVQDKALQEAFGMNWEQMDEAWRRYVMKRYPRR